MLEPAVRRPPRCVRSELPLAAGRLWKQVKIRHAPSRPGDSESGTLSQG